MPRTILVPLDGSPLAERALPQACSLATQPGAALVLVRATPPIARGGGRSSPPHSTVREARTYLQRIQRRLANLGLAVRVAVRHGDPRGAILRTARRHGADLLVMSTHGCAGPRRFGPGSVAAQVLAMAEVPVLLVATTGQPAARDAGPYRRILVPLDGTVSAEAALLYLERHQLARHAEVLLLRAMPPALPAIWPAMPSCTPQQVRDRVAMASAQALVGARQYLDTIGRTHFRGEAHGARVVIGHAARAILDAAAAEDVDLIAMATHGRPGFDRVAPRSVAARVVQHAPVPVLLVGAAWGDPVDACSPAGQRAAVGAGDHAGAYPFGRQAS